MPEDLSGEVLAASVVTMDPPGALHQPGLIRWSGGRLQEVRRATDAEWRRTPPSKRHTVAVPGFVNTHHHLASTLLTGLSGSRSPSLQGLESSQQRRLAASLDEDLSRSAALHAYTELIRSGITTTTDSQAAWRTDRRVDGSLRAAHSSGLRVLATVAFLDRTHLIPATARFDPTSAIDELFRLRTLFAGPRVEVEPEPLSLPRCTDALITALHQQRLRRSAMHLNYSAALDAWARSELGHPALVHLAQLGVLDDGWLLAHPLHLDDEEVELLATSGSSVSYCPTSNLAMGLASPSLARLAENGIPIGLGLDHPNGSSDALANAKCALIAQRSVAADPEAIDATEALELLTCGGARALGLEEHIGCLREGSDADVAVFDDLPAAVATWEEMAELLVMGGGRYRPTHVLAGGRWLLRDGTVELPGDEPVPDPIEVRRELWRRCQLGSSGAPPSP